MWVSGPPILSLEQSHGLLITSLHRTHQAKVFAGVRFAALHGVVLEKGSV
jgi:hypothetical protein